ncbi:MAG: DUF1707 and DUF4870 domain-containing protein [Propionibacteriaceae bacterium]|nr:DUF1707 and DUF4870 domain-containing protein [Propionibacteriaceae bacterium]
MPLVDSHHPALRVCDADRQRATQILSDAYCEGRLDEVELDQRLSAAMSAQSRHDLAASLAGLPPEVRHRDLARRTGNASAGFAHLSALFTWIFGPLLVHALATPGSVSRKESAKAFNFQLISGILFLVTAIVAGTLLPEAVVAPVMLAGWLAWLSLTIVGGARALAGQAWRNPVTRVVRWEALDTRGR